MTVQSASLTAMIGWFSETARILKAGWRRFAAAALWTILVVLVPIVLLIGLGFALGIMNVSHDPAHPFGENATLFWVGYGAVVLVSLIVQPALTAGWFGMCGDVDVGRGGRGRDIFAPFRNRTVWWRSLAVTLLTFLGIALIGAITVGPFIPGFIAFDHAMTLHTANAAAGIASEPPFPPIGLFFGYFVFLFAIMFLQAISLMAMAEVAMRPTAPVAAVVIAARAILRNVFKLILIWFLASTLLGVAMMVVILPLGALAVGLSFINPILGMVVFGIAYVALIMAMYPLMFVFVYVMWKGLLADAAPPAADATTFSA